MTSRHLGTTVVLLLIGALLLLTAAFDGPEYFLWHKDVVSGDRPRGQLLVGGFAVILVVSAVALPARTTFGLWLGRAAGLVLIGCAAYLLWLVLFVRASQSSWGRQLDFVIMGPVILLLAATGLGVLVALRKR